MEKIIYKRIKETENLSRRALIMHYDAFLSELNLEDHTLIYSWPYYNDFALVLESESNRKSVYVLSFCEKHGFSCHYKNGKCTRCISEKNGLGNPEIHKKTIDAQIKNGTFNMMDPEVQKKKSSNSNIKFKRINLYCETCQKITDHRIWNNGATNCSICNAKNNGPKIKICPIHGETLHNGSYCIKCNPESFSMPPKPEMKICPIHGETLHNGKVCLTCHPESVGGFIKNFLPEKLQPCGHKSKSVFNGKNYVCWQCYKEDYLQKIQKSEIQDFVKVPKDKESIISEMEIGNVFLTLDENKNPLKLSKNYQEDSLLYEGNLSIEEVAQKLNIPYKYKYNFLPESLQSCGHTSKSVFDGESYVCWQCYKDNYLKKIKKDNLTPHFGGEIVPTFLDQNKTNSIPGNKFEKYLEEMNIGWFVYIKYHENGKPLVVGKSGSILVNSNGSDLSFDKNQDGGPARQLLIETNTNWNREYIEIIKCLNEKDSLIKELNLQNEYNIFRS